MAPTPHRVIIVVPDSPRPQSRWPRAQTQGTTPATIRRAQLPTKPCLVALRLARPYRRRARLAPSSVMIPSSLRRLYRAPRMALSYVCVVHAQCCRAPCPLLNQLTSTMASSQLPGLHNLSSSHHSHNNHPSHWVPAIPPWRPLPLRKARSCRASAMLPSSHGLSQVSTEA